MFCSYYYNINVLPNGIHNEIRIHITSIYCVSCLQCSVNRSCNSFPQ